MKCWQQDEFLHGVASAFELEPDFPPPRLFGRWMRDRSLSSEEALQRDWHAIAQDFRAAFESDRFRRAVIRALLRKYEQEHGELTAEMLELRHSIEQSKRTGGVVTDEQEEREKRKSTNSRQASEPIKSGSS